MNIEEAITRKEDIEHEMTQRLNAFTEERGLTIENIRIQDVMRVHGLKDKIRISLDKRYERNERSSK